jgi:hypothetical protein
LGQFLVAFTRLSLACLRLRKRVAPVRAVFVAGLVSLSFRFVLPLRARVRRCVMRSLACA